MIVPSIDLMGGRVVQLRQGREKVLEGGDPEELAQRFARYGEVAVIDLDAALGQGDNESLIRRLCSLAPCRVGGGIRTVEKGKALLRAGARKIIIGTRATPDFLQQFPASKLLAALDEDAGEIVDRGWRHKTGQRAIGRAAELAPFVSGFLHTLVDQEGTLRGADLARFQAFMAVAGRPVTVAGGIATVDEVVALDRLGADCQVGMAIYTGQLDLTQAFIQCMDFAKGAGLLPAAIRDTAGRMRMLGYMNEEALGKTLQSGLVTLWSRSKARLWQKGEQSGNTLKALTVRPDCDRDALLVVAAPEGPTCHKGTISCFGDSDFALSDLEAVINRRIQQQTAGSYTARLAADPALIRAKLIEESQEITEAPDQAAIIHEAADMLYHLLVLLASEDISLDRVIHELDGRRTWNLVRPALNPRHGGNNL